MDHASHVHGIGYRRVVDTSLSLSLSPCFCIQNWLPWQPIRTTLYSLLHTVAYMCHTSVNDDTTETTNTCKIKHPGYSFHKSGPAPPRLWI